MGADRSYQYLPLIEGKKVAVVANQTSILTRSKEHLVDFLVSKNVELIRIFAPEHGFRGDHSAGAIVSDGKDVKTGLPIVSLYGNNRKPTAAQMEGIDVVIFDIQDVGARFYTYISTMHYVMEAAAENNVQVIVLDRPNPHGDYIDGPVLKEGYESFVGMHQVPVVHGLTIGEYAHMINDEGWLKNGIICNLQVIKMSGWVRENGYVLPIAPSPNLPNDLSIKLYPSLCFFEGTVSSLGRGTEFPFQVVGYPGMENGNFEFTPRSIPGVSDHPKFENVKCLGIDFRNDPIAKSPVRQLHLEKLISVYRGYPSQDKFFTSFFDKLAGSGQLRQMIEEGKTEDEIRASWQEDLKQYSFLRGKYLLYR